MGSVKSQVLLLFDFFDRGKKHGAVHKTKIFCDETKILSGIWISDHGRDNRRLTGDGRL